mgnify:CR=1 FL=1
MVVIGKKRLEKLIEEKLESKLKPLEKQLKEAIKICDFQTEEMKKESQKRKDMFDFLTTVER